MYNFRHWTKNLKLSAFFLVSVSYKQNFVWNIFASENFNLCGATSFVLIFIMVSNLQTIEDIIFVLNAKKASGILQENLRVTPVKKRRFLFDTRFRILISGLKK